MITPLDLRVGWYLARRQIRRASKWTTGLIVFVMLLTFLNLVVVTGVLVGIVVGISNQYRAQEIGDVVITALDTKNYIEQTPEVLAFVTSLPQVKTVSARYIGSGQVEANYLTRTNLNDKPNKTGATIVGVDPSREETFSHLSRYVTEGQYFASDDYDQVIVGSQFIDRYSFGSQPGLTPLKNVYPGTKIKLTLGSNTREVTVKGVMAVPANSPLAAEVLMPEKEMRQMLGRSDYSANEIALILEPGVDPAAVRDLLLRSDIGKKAKVRTFEQAIPNGVLEVQGTFASIGNAISSVGLVVASITIFIVIFINAITRRKFIGILKAIGISTAAIETAYLFQSLFYALIGAGIGLAILYGFLVPYITAHPIVLPISNAILVAPVPDTFVRILLLVVATMVAGYIPARMIVQKNTLESILGRN